MRFLVVVLLATVAAGDAPAPSDVRKVESFKKVDLPWKRLKLADGVEIGEGPRGELDRFPFWVAKKGDKTYAVTRKNLRYFLKRNEDGSVIREGFDAMELVRTFTPGIVIDWKDTGEEVIAAARKAGVAVGEYRPPHYAIRAERDGKVWKVTATALEIIGGVRMVHYTLKVAPTGSVTRKRTVVFESEKRGVMLSCAAAAIGVPGHVWPLARAMERFDHLKQMLGKPAASTKNSVTYDIMSVDGKAVFTSDDKGRLATAKLLTPIWKDGKRVGWNTVWYRR